MSKEIKIEIPQTISVGQYQKFGTLDYLTNTERIIRIVSAISGYTEVEVSTWNVGNLFAIYKDLNNRIEELHGEFLPIFEWRGTTWGFQPLHKMTGGEYIDLESRLNEGIGSLNEVLAILYRPIKSHQFDGLKWKVKNNIKYALGKSENLFKYYTLEEYDIDSRLQREELFKDLPIALGLGAYNFFLFVGQSYSKDLVTSFQNTMGNLNLKEKKELHRLLLTTGGSSPSIN